MFYFDNNFTKLIANYISDSEKFNEGYVSFPLFVLFSSLKLLHLLNGCTFVIASCLKMAPFHYLSDVKLDTSVSLHFKNFYTFFFALIFEVVYNIILTLV